MSRRSIVGVMASAAAVWLVVAGQTSAAEADGQFRLVTVGPCADERLICLTEPLLAGSAVTALDLLRDLYPGLAGDGHGQRFAGADAVEDAADPDAADEAEREIDLGGRDWVTVAVIAAGQTAFAAAVSGGVVVLAAVKPAYKPLGRLYVATDPGGPATGYRLLLVGPGRPLVATLNSHFNSDEGFDTFLLAGLAGGSLVDLHDGPFLYSVKQPSDRCMPVEHAETPSVFSAAKSRHHGLADIRIVITYTRTCVEGDERRIEATSTFPMTLIFDGRRYQGGSGKLDRLNTQLAE